MSKKIKEKVHATYSKKCFLAPNSIRSMAAIHAKIKATGEASVRISDCNNSVKIWNNLNSKEEVQEMIEKLDMLIVQLMDFKEEVKIKLIKS